MYDVITIGSATQDVFISTPMFKVVDDKNSPTGKSQLVPHSAKTEIEDITLDTGGGATNGAVTFSRLGLKTATFARIGDDPAGKEVITSLRTEGVKTTLIHKSKNEHTGYSAILLNPKGRRTIFVHRGASQRLKANEIPWRRMQTNWFYVTSLAGNITLLRKIVAHAEKIGAKVAYNPGNKELEKGLKILGPILKRIDIVNLNREEAAELTGIPQKDIKKIHKQLCQNVKELALITDGRRGAYTCSPDGLFFAPALDVKIVNTTGAGDAFGSAFVAGHILKDDVEYALRLAILNSNSAIQKMGAKHGLLKELPSKQRLAKVKVIKK